MKKVGHILIAAFIVQLSFSQTKKIYPNTYALVVGISDYPGSHIDLKNPVNDAKGVVRFLKSSHGENVPKENIYYLINEKAKRNNIIHYAQKLFKKAKGNDRVLLFFSGHGSEDGSLVSYDFDPEVKSYGLDLEDVKTIMRAAKCRTKLIIVDACYSGKFKGSRKQNNTNSQTQSKPAYNIFTRHAFEDVFKKNKEEQVVLMLSSSPNEVSLDGSKLKQGVFTYALLRGLEGKADLNKNKKITINELFKYAYNFTVKYSSKLYSEYGESKQQTPQLFGNFNKGLIVGVLEK